MTLSVQGAPLFTVTPIDLNSPEIARLTGDDADITCFAPSTHDGPLAPVLRRQLDELPERANDNIHSGSAAVDTGGVVSAK